MFRVPLCRLRHAELRALLYRTTYQHDYGIILFESDELAEAKTRINQPDVFAQREDAD